MILRVGPFLYRVRKVASPLLYEGQPCLGLCDFQQQEILIADQGSELQQIQVIGHEYMEAWLHHMGPHLDDHQQKEAACDTFGMALTQFVMDYTRAIRQHVNHTAVADGQPAATPSDGNRIAAASSPSRSRPVSQPKIDKPGLATKRSATPAAARWAGKACSIRSQYHPLSSRGGWMVRVMEPV